MTRLNCFFKLARRVAVYVPGTMGANTEANTSAETESTAALLSECFGGASSMPVSGYWMSAEHGLVTEKTTVVYANATEEDLAECLPRVITHCIGLLHGLRQEAIALEIDGALHLIDQKAALMYLSQESCAA